MAIPHDQMDAPISISITILTGQIMLLVNSSEVFGTAITFYGSVVGGSGSVEVTDNNIIVTGLSYTGFHTVCVVAASAVCPGVLNSSIDVSVMFNIRSEWTTCQRFHFYYTISQLLYILT